MNVIISRLSIGTYRNFIRFKGKIFSILISKSFKYFGKKSVILLPLRISGEKNISIGNNVFIGAGSWLQVHNKPNSTDAAIKIGNGTSIVGGVTISAAKSVVIEKDVLIAGRVYISDHTHQYVNPNLPIQYQGITGIARVRIGEGAWIGQNVVIGPGVTIGKGAVIGANSFVNRDVPNRTIAVGSPAHVIRQIDA